MQKKNVLLTGGGGSIGVHVIAHLMHNTNWNVVVLDSFQHKGYKDRIKRVMRNHPDWKDRVKVFHHNLTCEIPVAMAEEMGYPDYILHLAAMSDVFGSVESPVWTIENNIKSTLNMLQYARMVQPQAFVYFSTDEVYGPVKKGEAHPEVPIHRPSNPYSASKAMSEDACYCYWRSYGVPLIVTNTMNNFGEMQSASKFPVIVQKKLEAGEKVTIHGNEEEIGSRYYIHSRNVADALLFILKHMPATRHKQGEIDEPDRYHIVGDKNYNNLELAQTIAKLMDKELDYEMEDFHKNNPAHDIHYGLQDNKLRPGGWQQPVDTETSLKNTIKWQQENREWI